MAWMLDCAHDYGRHVLRRHGYAWRRQTGPGCNAGAQVRVDVCQSPELAFLDGLFVTFADLIRAMASLAKPSAVRADESAKVVQGAPGHVHPFFDGELPERLEQKRLPGSRRSADDEVHHSRVRGACCVGVGIDDGVGFPGGERFPAGETAPWPGGWPATFAVMGPAGHSRVPSVATEPARRARRPGCAASATGGATRADHPGLRRSTG